jgi:hypothetical protein
MWLFSAKILNPQILILGLQRLFRSKEPIVSGVRACELESIRKLSSTYLFRKYKNFKIVIGFFVTVETYFAISTKFRNWRKFRNLAKLKIM